jgi:hypothetical protein
MSSNFSAQIQGRPWWRNSSSSLSATVELFFVPATADDRDRETNGKQCHEKWFEYIPPLFNHEKSNSN